MTCNVHDDIGAYLRDCIAWETEGERTPAQTNPDELVNLAGIVLVTRETAEALSQEAA